MQQLKRVALENRYLIKTCLNVTISEKLTPVAIAQKLLDKVDLRLSYVGRLGPRGKRECVYKFVGTDDGRDVVFSKWLKRDEAAIVNSSVSVSSNINVPTPITHTTSLPSNEDMEGQDNPSDSWWQQVKSYAALFRERVKDGVGAVKEFLSTLSSDERWGVMVAFEEAQPQIFRELVAIGTDWVVWMG
ncbi:hypothetical protein LC593_14215 [Nostoc sp. CHAB 5844]|nr:hypothetical protein [Nostoc sp. CHAB 5844]